MPSGIADQGGSPSRLGVGGGTRVESAEGASLGLETGAARSALASCGEASRGARLPA